MEWKIGVIFFPLYSFNEVYYRNNLAQVVELVDTRDLKSLEGNFVPVQVRLWAPPHIFLICFILSILNEIIQKRARR